MDPIYSFYVGWLPSHIAQGDVVTCPTHGFDVKLTADPLRICVGQDEEWLCVGNIISMPDTPEPS